MRKNKMKYHYNIYDFSWKGTSHIFDQVHIHEKTHDEEKSQKLLRKK